MQKGWGNRITQPCDRIAAQAGEISFPAVDLVETGSEGSVIGGQRQINRKRHQYSRQHRLGYVHLRNVRDKVPHYKETFIDDGEVDVIRVLAILKRNGFAGVIIPDHAPQMSCAAPWHAGMAYALGFLKAGIMSLEGRR